MSAYRVAGWLGLLAAAAVVVTFALGHPLDGLAGHLTQGAGR